MTIIDGAYGTIIIGQISRGIKMSSDVKDNAGVKYEPPVPSAHVILEEGMNPMPPKKWWQFWRTKDVV